jgi:hypothetical protein
VPCCKPMHTKAVRIGPGLALYFDSGGSARYRSDEFTSRRDVVSKVKTWLTTASLKDENYAFVQSWHQAFDASRLLPSPKPYKKRIGRSRVAAGRSSPLTTVKEIVRPTKPRASDFGLTPERVSWFQSTPELRQRTTLIILGACLVGSIWLAKGNVFIVIVEILPYGLLCYFLIGWVIAWLITLVHAFRIRKQEDFGAFHSYEATVRVYESSLRAYHNAIAEQFRRQVTWWQSLSGPQFESELALLLQKRGYRVRQTGGSRDGGVDLVLERDNLQVIVQCKAYAAPVGPAATVRRHGWYLHQDSHRRRKISPQGSRSSSGQSRNCCVRSRSTPRAEHSPSSGIVESAPEPTTERSNSSTLVESNPSDVYGSELARRVTGRLQLAP